jgi:glucose/arabinose dehydrogenase
MKLLSLAAFTLATAAAATTVPAQTYQTVTIATGLNKPVGIAVHSSGDLYFTEVPDPGKRSKNNTVSMRDARSGKITQIVTGEPAPTHIAVLADRTFYWTCNTAGVIMRGTGTSHTAIATGLSNCNGLTVTDKGRVFFTQIPTPGKSGTMGGKNNIAELVNGKAMVLKAGEPEPVDIVADAAGNLYWTCRTAGVILRRDAKTKGVSLVLDKLDSPSGIAMDAAGNLYFTEVPTPGKGRSQGGRNAVWKYDPATRNLTPIQFGVPEPADVTVSADGANVYWTCSTAGVIQQAVRTGSAPTITSTSRNRIGDNVDLDLSAPGLGNQSYLAASSLGDGPVPIAGRLLGLTPDGLFVATALGQGAPFFSGFVGRLDSAGKARARIAILNDAALKGVNIYTAFGVMDMKAPNRVAALSSTLRFKIQ